MFYQFHHSSSPDYLKAERGENLSFPTHLHQCFEIITVLSGQMEITVDGNKIFLCANESLLIFPNQLHSFYSEKSEHIMCIFSPLLVQAYANKVAGMVPKNSKFILDDYIIESLSKLKHNSSISLKKGILYLLCSKFDENAEYILKHADSEKLLFKIFLFVEKEFAGDCTLKSLSKSTGYDYSYLSRFFKKTVGITFNTYVNHYRLNHACYLMDNFDYSIIRCAMESGYNSVRSFNRNFKEQFGITPEEYRN